MPFYEYRCESCGHELEALQKISDEHLKQCPECAEGVLRRLISAAAFRLKGGGWYETDFKTGAKRNVAGDDGGGGKADSAKGDGKSDGKGDGKAPPAKSDSKSDAKPAKPAAAKANGSNASPS